MRITDASRDARGFTLLEVMIALAILAGVVTTLLVSLNYHLGVAAENREVLTAAVLGREKAEEVAVFGRPEEGPGAHGDFGAAHPGYSWAFSTAEDKESLMVGFERVEIQVRWAKNREITFVSYLPKQQ